MNCKGKNSLGPGSLVGKKRHKMGWKEVQKQLASERSEPSGGLAKGKGRRLFPSQVTCSACLARLFVFCAFHPVFCFLSHQGAWSWARGKIKQKEDRSNLCSGKKNPKKKFRLIQDSNILPMQLECCTSISQWFKSCNSQNYFSLSFVASVSAKIFFAFKIILISTCSLHLWVICNVTSSKNFGRKHIYCYCRKTSK